MGGGEGGEESQRRLGQWEGKRERVRTRQGNGSLEHRH